MSDLQEIGFRIAVFRKKKQLKQEDFAAPLSMSRSSLAQIETGKANITLTQLIDIIAKYPLTVDYLLTGKDENQDLLEENEQLKQRVAELEKLNATQETLIEYIKKDKKG